MRWRRLQEELISHSKQLRMIVVIADDFAGAAELAGISLRYGLKAVVCLHDELDDTADVLVIDTNSRSLKKEKALKVTRQTLERIVSLKPAFIYKKIDSVLRGHVIDELKIQMRLTGFNKVFILPANPSLGRTINNGEYFVDGMRVNESSFAFDPEFPAQSSFIVEMLGDPSLSVLKHSEKLPSIGYAVGEAADSDDIKAWACKLDKSWMLGGAGDFYTALLDKQHNVQTKHGYQLELPHLYVCGTSYPERKEQIKKMDKERNPVSYLPVSKNNDWIMRTKRILELNGKAMIAINETDASPLLLRTQMAKAVKKVFQYGQVKELFIEGGSTAAAVLAELNVTNLLPLNEIDRGVVRMKAGEFHVTVKPGSYPLPDDIKRLYGIE